jgi:uncharacterized GH25 family protein
MFKYVLALCLCTATAIAHDTWVETNCNLIRTGDAIYVDLKLGNHGNNHRDFKIAGKVDVSGCTLAILDETGKSFDLLPEAIDTGYAPKEGFWNAKYSPAKPGIYLVAHQLDQVVSYAPVRSIKSAKTTFVVSDTLDRLSRKQVGFDRPLGHPLELVPLTNPVIPMGPGQEIKVQLLFEGKPLSDVVVSFIPRGQALKAEFDADFERKTDAKGIAAFTPKTGNAYLVVAHHQLPRTGQNYESTKYSATFTVFVPEICPCCIE